MARDPNPVFLIKFSAALGRLDAQGLQTVVQRFCAPNAAFLETLFDAIEDGILVLDENDPRAIYFKRSGLRGSLGLQPGEAEG